MKLTKNGIAILENDCISGWVEQSGRLDHDQNALPQILKFIKPGMTVFDVGAHIGSHTIAYLKAVGPDGVVFAFEPNPAAFECLVHNLQGYTPNEQIFTSNAALGLDLKPLRMVLDNTNPGATHISDSTSSFEVRAGSLDYCEDFLPDVIKLDCEGYEPFVLIGGRELLLGTHPILILEVNEGALNRYGFTCSSLFALLEAFGYSIRNLYPNQPCAGPQYDIVATPKL